MNPAWVAVVVTGAVAVAGFGAWALALTFQAGKHAQRMDTAEKSLEKLQETVAGHANSISAWDQAVKLLEEVRKDVKSLMTGRRGAPRTEG